MSEKWGNPACIGEHRIAGHADIKNNLEISLNGTWGFKSVKGTDVDDYPCDTNSRNGSLHCLCGQMETRNSRSIEHYIRRIKIC